ncbi:putative ferric-chelate reductase 1 [Notolabrus celidotus]|uniref:putative ferric-chelate reductase 1 n=1 Tax=Notolabrus celidotus TaxID=1203425 RepID=UPI0014900573|nr:putative ferric-chelate reductase 1 [Notolabrus celidotus]
MAPVGLRCLLLTAALVWHWVPAGCYSNGKVTSACYGMEPQHRATAQTSPSPHRLTVNTIGFSPGDQIQVVLSGNPDFEGFLLQARDAAYPDSVYAIGTFSLTDPKRTQLLTCNNIKGSAVSHTSSVRQKEVVVTWTAPSDSPMRVQFFVTVVSRFRVFWVKVPGPIIYQHGFTPFPTQPETIPPPNTPSILPGPFTSEGCGRTKTCLQDPPGCDPDKDYDCFFLSMTAEEPTQSVMFELSGPDDGYVAFALSLDTWMGDDDVYMCVKDGDRVSVSAAFSRGRAQPEGNSQSGLSMVSWRLSHKAMQCRFSRPVSLPAQRFNLDGEYYLFLAHGLALRGRIQYHSRQPLISTHRKLITGPPEVLSGSRASILMKMHGALMVVAWMLTGSIGTFIASYFRSEWPNQSILGEKVWFQLHRGLMVLTLVLTVVAFSLPFVYRGGWSSDAGAHPYLGCTVLTLSLIQPIIAVLRPPPDSDRRYIFKWVHLGLGTVAEALAVVAIFLGMRQSSLLLPQAASSVLFAYSMWLVCNRSLFLSLKYLQLTNSRRYAYEQNREQFSQWVSLVRTRLLLFFVVGNVALLVAFLYFLSQV